MQYGDIEVKSIIAVIDECESYPDDKTYGFAHWSEKFKGYERTFPKSLTSMQGSVSLRDFVLCFQRKTKFFICDHYDYHDNQ